MRVRTILKEELKLTEREYKMLLNRNDLKHAKKRVDSTGVYYRIKKPCICEFYEFYCANAKGKKCPFMVFGDTKEHYGCVSLLFSILGYYSYPSFDTDAIRWDADKDKVARANIKKVRRALLKMKKV